MNTVIGIRNLNLLPHNMGLSHEYNEVIGRIFV